MWIHMYVCMSRHVCVFICTYMMCIHANVDWIFLLFHIKPSSSIQ